MRALYAGLNVVCVILLTSLDLYIATESSVILPAQGWVLLVAIHLVLIVTVGLAVKLGDYMVTRSEGEIVLPPGEIKNMVNGQFQKLGLPIVVANIVSKAISEVVDPTTKTPIADEVALVTKSIETQLAMLFENRGDSPNQEAMCELVASHPMVRDAVVGAVSKTYFTSQMGANDDPEIT